MKKLLFLTLCLICTIPISAQNSVTGKISDGETGEGLPGVNIVVKGTTIGSVSDLNGNFSVNVPELGDTLEFSFVGYNLESVPYIGQSSLEISLIPELKSLDEVVVVGYGVMKKSDITGSIISVKEEELKNTRTGNVLQGLQGRLPGVDIQSDNGRAGAGISIGIRGQRSLVANNAPLVIVDGIPYGENIDVSQEDIKSIEVLKDVSSTAIYGARGANGVILITTKKGSEGKSKIYFSSYFGISEPFQKVPNYDKDGYMNAKYASVTDWEDSLDVPTMAEAFPQIDEQRGIANGYNTDWQDLLLKNGNQQNYHLGITGGNENVNFNTSIDYYKESGVVLSDDFQRYTLSFNLEGKVNKFLSIGTSSIFSYRQKDGPSPSFTDAVRLSPLLSATDSITNEYLYAPSSQNPRRSPLAVAENDIEQTSSYRIFPNVYAEFDIMNGVTFRSTFGFDLETSRYGYMRPPKDIISGYTRGVYGDTVHYNWDYTWQNVFSIVKSFDKHSFNITLGSETRYLKHEFYGISGYDQPFSRSLWYSLKGNKDITVESNYKKRTMVSFFGRINYSLADKYIISLTERYDGASQLYPGYKWAAFPSVGVAWRIKNEKFMDRFDFISDLKLRIGYGVSGNESIDPYTTMASLNPNPYYYEFGTDDAETPAYAYRPESLVSKDVTWERTKGLNGGIDIGLFGNRIITNIDLYNAFTTKMLIKSPMPLTSGYDKIYSNLGKTHSYGIELVLQTTNINSKNFKWKSTVSYTSYRDEVLEISEGIDRVINDNDRIYWIVGQPVNIYYDNYKTGIWQLDEEALATSYKTEPGLLKILDANKDGNLTSEDRVVYNRSPKWYGSLDNTFSVYNFNLTFNIYARMKYWIRATSYQFDPRMYDNMLAVDYWTRTNPTNEYPRYNSSTAEYAFEDVLMYRDGSYIKIKYITLNYQFGKKVLSKTPVSQASIYFTSKNPFLIYSELMDGLDPERNGSMDWPIARVWMAGINIEF